MFKFALLFAAACSPYPIAAQQARVIPGLTMKSEDATVVMTYFGCARIPGVPLGPIPDCVPGVMVSVQISNPAVLAAIVSIQIVNDAGELRTLSSTITINQGSQDAFSSAGFSIGLRPVVSITVTPLTAIKSATFN